MIARRRLLLASGVLLAPRAVLAQAASKVYRVGVLGLDPAKAKTAAQIWDALVAELARRGYVEGRNLTFVVRSGDKDGRDLDRAAADLVALAVDLIVAISGPAAYAAKRSTQTAPIFVFSTGDPVRGGLIASLARPGGNITGNAILQPQLTVKRLQLIADAVGKPARIAVLSPWYPGLDVATAVAERRAQFHFVQVESADKLAGAFEAMARQRVDALVVESDVMTFVNAERIAAHAAQHRLPAIAEVRQFPEAGLLMSYGVDYAEMARKSAERIDRILKGANPGDLPFERAAKFEFVVNLKTAKALGLTIPQAILLRADEVIE